MKKKIVAMMLSVVMCCSLAACGKTVEEKTNQQDTLSTTQTDDNTQSKEPVAEQPEIQQPETQQKELSGKVVVYMPSPSGLNAKYVEDFENKTGVTVELFEGTTGEILARLEAEKDNPIADVVVLASWSDGLSLKESGILQSYIPQNAELIYDGWIDEDSMLFGTSASAVGVIYNTTLIESLDADWAELAIYYPASGTVINPRPAMILNSSANLDNAQAFVDYLLSDDAQQLVADAYLLPGRSDITCTNRTNVADIPTFEIDWNTMMETADDAAATLNELCK